MGHPSDYPPPAGQLEPNKPPPAAVFGGEMTDSIQPTVPNQPQTIIDTPGRDGEWIDVFAIATICFVTGRYRIRCDWICEMTAVCTILYLDDAVEMSSFENTIFEIEYALFMHKK